MCDVRKGKFVTIANKTFIQLSQAKWIPPKVCIFRDQAQEFNFNLAYAPGIENPVARYFYRLAAADTVFSMLPDLVTFRYRIKNNMISETPKVYEDEEALIPGKLSSPDHAIASDLH